jgi:hypothetical protein
MTSMCSVNDHLVLFHVRVVWFQNIIKSQILTPIVMILAMLSIECMPSLHST